jgi:hypothetical protein
VPGAPVHIDPRHWLEDGSEHGNAIGAEEYLSDPEPQKAWWWCQEGVLVERSTASGETRSTIRNAGTLIGWRKREIAKFIESASAATNLCLRLACKIRLEAMV